MKDPFPGITRHRLGDAEFTLIKTTGSAKEAAPVTTLHCHRYFEIHCNSGSEKRLPLPTGEITLESGSFLVICPGCMHYSVDYPDGSCVLSFELRQCPGEAGFFTHFMRLLNSLNLKCLPASRKFRSAFEAYAHETPEATILGFCREQLLALQALVAFLEELSACAQRGDPPYTPEHTGAFDAALDMMLYTNLTLGQIANQLGYSPRHTARLIRRRYGDSLGAIRKKLENASKS